MCEISMRAQTAGLGSYPNTIASNVCEMLEVCTQCPMILPVQWRRTSAYELSPHRQYSLAYWQPHLWLLPSALQSSVETAGESMSWHWQ